MTDEQANNWRLYASEILRKLYFAGQEEQLKVLADYANECLLMLKLEKED